MRRKISLYIADRLVDLDDQSLILFNYTMEDMNNPTIVKNSYSQQITIKGTPGNNKLFGDIFRLDRVTTNNGSTTGTDFDPMRKTAFTIFNELGEILESGYCRLDSISRERRNVEYQVSLFGGLGSFLYSLSYNDNGTKKTLADLMFFGNDTPFNMVISKSVIEDAWENLATGRGEQIYDVINFAPCYNGIPKGNFDAKKVFLKAEEIPGVASSVQEGDVSYSAKNGYTLISFPDAFTEWEVQDLRSYLQRPVLNVTALLNAICDTRNNGGFSVTIDSNILNDDINGAWLTLPMIANADIRTSTTISVNKQSLLGGMGSPAEWLLSLVKMFNWRFVFDNDNKSVSILSNSSFFRNEISDITRMIDMSKSVDIVPLSMDSRWLKFGLEASGDYASMYLDRYGIDFGSVRVDTGYPFNADTKDLLDGVIAKGAVMVTETSKFYRTMKQEETGKNYPSFMLTGSVNQTLWDADGNAKEFPCGEAPDTYDLEYDNGRDFFPKMQLHEADNKSIDGSGVLCWYIGHRTTQGLRYHLTDDDAYMYSANNDVPCWKVNLSESELQGVPMFSRYKMTAGYISESFDFSNPSEIPIPSVTIDENAPIYARHWKKYIADRYDRETRKLTCRVYWGGRKVNQDLFRSFYWIGGAIWSLNAIRNHSLTTYDPVECEFIKVQDIANYTTAEPTPVPPVPTDPQIVYISPSGTQTIGSDAGTLQFTITTDPAGEPVTMSTAATFVSFNPETRLLSYGENTASSSRTAVLNFRLADYPTSPVKQVTLVQEAKPEDLFIKVDGVVDKYVNISANAQDIAVTLEYTDGAEVTISQSKTFATIDLNTLNISVEQNTGTARTVTFWFVASKNGRTAEASLTLYQAGA